MMDENASDGSLVARAIDGDRAAFSMLVSRHYERIYRVACHLCGRREDAEDIAQDVCIKLGRSIQSWSGDAAFSTWLYRVVVNAVRDHQRRRAADGRKLDAWAADPTRPDIEEARDNADEEAARDLWARVQHLPPKQRETLLLVFSEGLSHAQAAEVLGCSTGTVASNIHDAKKRLRMMIEETNVTGNKARV